MGAASGHSPSKIANEFARVYYNVVAKLPYRLSELYGDDSQLDHGSIHAIGRHAIAKIAVDLPIVQHSPVIDSVVGQSSVNGNVVIAVRGTHSSPPIHFVQTFLLAKQSNSHNEHFYCRNDIFMSLRSEKSDDAKSDAPSSEPSGEPVTPPETAPTLIESAGANPASVDSTDAHVDVSSSISTVTTASAHADPAVARTIRPSVILTPPTPLAPILVDSRGNEVPGCGNWIRKKISATPEPRMVSRNENALEASALQPRMKKGQDTSSVCVSEIMSGLSNETASGSIQPATMPNASLEGRHPNSIIERAPQRFMMEPMFRLTDSIAVNRHARAAASACLKSPALRVRAESISSRPVTDKLFAPKSINRGGVQQISANRKTKQDYRAPNAGPTNVRNLTSAKKTWALVVASKENTTRNFKKGGASEQVVNEAFVSKHPEVPTNEKVKKTDQKSLASGLSTSRMTKISPQSTTPTNRGSDEDKRGQFVHNGVSALGRAGHPRRNATGSTANTARPMVPGRPPRAFGPSAVVTLASTKTRPSDLVTLKKNLREEFGKYGHNLRGVEIKADKGIAFLEYDSIDGVRSAVAAWANGPRQDGVFAGVALHVTEKRGMHLGRRSRFNRGGGRIGSTRGSQRRERPTPGAPVA